MTVFLDNNNNILSFIFVAFFKILIKRASISNKKQCLSFNHDMKKDLKVWKKSQLKWK